MNTESTKRGRGQPRKYKSNAARQRAYRRRKHMEERIALTEYLFRTYRRQISREDISEWTLRKLRYRWKHDRPRQLRFAWVEVARERVEEWRASLKPKNTVTVHSEPKTTIDAPVPVISDFSPSS